MYNAQSLTYTDICVIKKWQLVTHNAQLKTDKKMKAKFKTNINCGGCIKSVTPFLNELDNLDEWKVDTDNPDKILEVILDDEDVDVIVETVKKAGFKIELIPLN